MNNHIYTFGGKIKIQRGFRCIGDRVIGVLAMVVMIWWSDKFLDKLKELNIVNELLKIFVDDVNGIYHPIAPGTEYIDGSLEWNPEKAVDEESKSEDERTMKVILDIANDIEGMIKMTSDITTNYEDKKNSYARYENLYQRGRQNPL